MSPIKVFISYAWGSKKIEQDVSDLVDFLKEASNGSVDVISDHLHQYTVPDQNFYFWLEHELTDARFGLLAITPNYSERFQKKGNPNEGKGVRWEAEKIIAMRYNQGGLNNKFYPILHDDADVNDIPDTLRGYYNEVNRFPSRKADILKFILTSAKSALINLMDYEVVDKDNIKKLVAKQFRLLFENGAVLEFSGEDKSLQIVTELERFGIHNLAMLEKIIDNRFINYQLETGAFVGKRIESILIDLMIITNWKKYFDDCHRKAQWMQLTSKEKELYQMYNVPIELICKKYRLRCDDNTKSDSKYV